MAGVSTSIVIPNSVVKMKFLAKEGIGIQRKKADVISCQQEVLLW